MTTTACHLEPSVYHHEGYLRAASLLEPRGELHVFRHGRAVVPLVVRPLPDSCGPGFDAISPYDFSGPVLHGESAPDVWRELTAWACAHDVITSFFRFDPLRGDANAWGGLVGLEVVHSADNIVIELSDPETMLSVFKPRVGRDMKVARRAGVVCAFDSPAREELDAFVPLYCVSMDRLGANPYYRFPRKFFDSLADALGDAFVVVSASVDGVVLASALLLLDGPTAYYYLACSSDAGRKACAMNMLVFESAAWLSEMGFARFHLGGGAASLRHFKERFGPGRIRYYVGRGVFDPRRYTQLTSGLCTNFFPAYRANP